MRFEEVIHAQTLRHLKLLMDRNILGELTEVVATFVDLKTFSVRIAKGATGAKVLADALDNFARGRHRRQNFLGELAAKTVFERRENLHAFERIETKRRNIRVEGNIARALLRHAIDFFENRAGSLLVAHDRGVGRGRVDGLRDMLRFLNFGLLFHDGEDACHLALGFRPAVVFMRRILNALSFRRGIERILFADKARHVRRLGQIGG